MQNIPAPTELDLITHVTHGVGNHLGQAIETLFEATEANIHGGNIQQSARGRRYAMSSAIHSFCAFEHAVNLFMFYTFKKEGNPLFRPEAGRSTLERRLVKNLQDFDVIGKFEVLTEGLKCCDNSKKYLPQLKEVRELRNRLCHGYTEEKQSLLKYVPGSEKRTQDGAVVKIEATYNTVACEYSPGSKKKQWEHLVPLTKLHHPDSLCEADAFTALAVCANAIEYLGSHLGLEFGGSWYYKGQTKIVSLGRKSSQAALPHVPKEPISAVVDLFKRRHAHYAQLNARKAMPAQTPSVRLANNG